MEVATHISVYDSFPVTVLSPDWHKIFALDYFEMDRLIEDLPKLYSCSCASSWFKVESQWNPTRDELGNKVVEFMNYFEFTPSVHSPTPPKVKNSKNALENCCRERATLVLKGDNKEVKKDTIIL